MDIDLPEIFKIHSYVSYYYTSQIDKYTGSHLRFKLNREICSGVLTFWTDIAQHVDQMNNDLKTDYMYIWVDYDYNLFNSDKGSVSIKPTLRYQIGKSGYPDYNRMKFELTTEIRFR